MVRDSFTPAQLFFWTALGATSAVLIYKSLFENERSLERRLERKKNKKADKKKPVRIWIDGCFDLMHMGHANAFRQARALGDVLVVGLNTDADIIKYKGAPIMTEEERFVAVSACKWVDEVVRDVPYVMNPEYLEMIFEKYDIDYVVHGDDPCLLPDGTDVFAAAKASGRFRTISRTEGVSTTDIVGRMLLMTKDHFHHSRSDSVVSESGSVHGGGGGDGHDEWETASTYDAAVTVPFTRETNFLPTARRINQFSNNTRPQPGDRVVYIDGAWDMFHAGHVEILKQAKELGDFLVVGVQSDVNVNKARGSNYPIMNLHERVLSVLACRYVDEVIMGAPWTVTADMIKTMNISRVCHGQVRDSDDRKYVVDSDDEDNAHEDGKSSSKTKSKSTRLDERPYRVAEEMGILAELKSTRKLLTQDIVTRILHARLAFEKKFEARDAKEKVYEANKEFVQEL